MDTLEMMKKFLAQDEELESFITGPAGSGKTTNLLEIVQFLNKKKVPYQVVAYTHKAKDVLISKLPENTPVSTLHSWLKKRPGINEKATHIKALMTSHQHGKPEPLELLIVDEFSFVGEKDYWSIGELQDEVLLEDSVTTYRCSCGSTDLTDDMLTCIACAEDNIKNTEIEEIVGEIPKPLKVLYVGDLNQLSPIDGPPAVMQHKPYWVELKTVYRNNFNALTLLPKMIEGKLPISYIEPEDNLYRNVDIDTSYKNDINDKIMLAYTNKAVQFHNAKIQGYSFPKTGDIIYNASTKEELIVEGVLQLKDVEELVVPGNKTINAQTKFNPFKTLATFKDIVYFKTDKGVYPCIFGYYNNKIFREQLGKALIDANKAGKDSKTEYKHYKVANDYISIVDFVHCQTIHKSQGQEFNNVYIDSSDLSICRDIQEQMKLLYVAMSRAKVKIFLNN